MKRVRPWTPTYRTTAIIALLATCLGTSCIGPRVYVLHRFDLPYSPDSTFAFPSTAPLDSADVSLVRPKQRRSAASRPPICTGFDVYALDTIPRSWQYSASSAGALPPSQFEVRMNRGTSPHLLVAYSYTLPLGQRDTATEEGAEQAARNVARQEAYARRAELLAHLILRQGPLPSTVAATETFRSQSLEEFEAHCDARRQPSN